VGECGYANNYKQILKKGLEIWRLLQIVVIFAVPKTKRYEEID
jgi:hypothetical protein